MGQPVVRQKDPHAGCTLTCGISMDVRVTNVRVNGDQPAAAAGPTACTMGPGAHGPGDPHVIFKPIGPAIAVGQPTACGGVEAAGSSNVHLVGQGGGWGKALFDWLNAPADPVLHNRLQGIADLEAGISTEMKAATLGMLPDPTFASKAAAAFFALRGADAIVAAKNRILTGQATETYVNQGVGNTARAAGASPELTAQLQGAVDTGLNLLGGKLQGRAGISKALTGNAKKSLPQLPNGYRYRTVNGNIQIVRNDAKNLSKLDLTKDGHLYSPTSFGSGRGRLGNANTQAQNASIAKTLENRGWTVTNIGRKEEYIPGASGGTKGSVWIDITAKKTVWGTPRTLRVQTIDTMPNKMTPTLREADNAARGRELLRSRGDNPHIILIPKR